MVCGAWNFGGGGFEELIGLKNIRNGMAESVGGCFVRLAHVPIFLKELLRLFFPKALLIGESNCS